jgi:hypothetical protein
MVAMLRCISIRVKGPRPLVTDFDEQQLLIANVLSLPRHRRDSDSPGVDA